MLAPFGQQVKTPSKIFTTSSRGGPLVSGQLVMFTASSYQPISTARVSLLFTTAIVEALAQATVLFDTRMPGLAVLTPRPFVAGEAMTRYPMGQS